MRRFVRLVTPALIAVVTASCVAFCAPAAATVAASGTVAPASAQPAWQWSAPAAIDPAAADPSGLSCSSPTWCVLADGTGNTASWNGTRWSRPVPTFSTGQHDGYSAHVYKVACGSPSLCMVWQPNGQVATWNGSGWTALAPTIPGAIADLSCAGTFCLAYNSVGTYVYRDGTWRTEAPIGRSAFRLSCAAAGFCGAVTVTNQFVTFSDGVWTAVPSVLADTVTGLDCPVAGFCEAITRRGSYTLRDGQVTKQVIGPAALPTVVSCASDRSCLAIGDGYYYRWDGTGWTRHVPTGELDTPSRGLTCTQGDYCVYFSRTNAYAFSSGSWRLTGRYFTGQHDGTAGLVACTGERQCVAVDDHAALFLHGEQWRKPEVALVDPNMQGDEDTENFGSMQCSADGDCLTTDTHLVQVDPDPDDGSAGYTQLDQTLWDVRSRGVWSQVGGPPVGQYSCARTVPLWCLVNTVDTDGAAQFYTFTGGVFTEVAGPPGLDVDRLSCVSPTFCVVARAQDARAAVWDGSAFSTPRAVDDVHLAAVSCFGRSQCLALDGKGRPVRYDGSAWSAPGPSVIGAPQQLSCGVRSNCLVEGENGGLAHFDGVTWTATTSPLARIDSIACGGPAFCVALDGAGDASYLTPSGS